MVYYPKPEKVKITKETGSLYKDKTDSHEVVWDETDGVFRCSCGLERKTEESMTKHLEKVKEGD